MSRASSSRLPSGRSLGGFKPHRASLVVFILGIVFSLNLFATLRTRARSRERLEFQRHVDEVASGLRSQLERPLEVLESVCALFDASVDVGRDEFARFARPALARHPNVRALEWIPLVAAADREQYEEAARAAGLAAFEFRELAADGSLVRSKLRAEYLPIYFMEPPDDRVLGFDLTADSARRAPVDRAQARRATVASERIRLIEDPPTSYSIAVFCPVFVPGSANARLRGVGAEVFRMREVVSPAVASALKLGTQLVVTDLGAPAETRVLFESSPGLADHGQDPASDLLRVRMDFADRQWSLSFSRAPQYRSQGEEAEWGILFTGIMLSALFALALSAARIILHLRRQVRAAQRLGQYTLVRKLGEGGMGMVWEARHSLLRRPTAIKLLRPEQVGAEAIARFEREVQLTSQLTHPNTVAIYDYGRTADGVFYYVMEYLDGLDLQRLVSFDGSRPQPPARVVHILKQVASALVEAHGRGLVHRDVKPANIMLCERGGLHDVAKVVDFGLVKRAAQQDANLSMNQVIRGTPMFLAPEAIADPEHVDGRSDLYACGAVAYFLLTGQPVFDGASLVEICSHHMFTQPQSPSERLGHALPPRLEQLVLRCLAKRPDERFESAAALFAALRECGTPVWTDAEAKQAWQRVARGRDAQTATARTVPTDSPSALAIDLGRRSNSTQR